MEISPLLPAMIGAMIGAFIGSALANYYSKSSGPGKNEERATEPDGDIDPSRSSTNE